MSDHNVSHSEMDRRDPLDSDIKSSEDFLNAIESDSEGFGITYENSIEPISTNKEFESADLLSTENTSWTDSSSSVKDSVMADDIDENLTENLMSDIANEEHTSEIPEDGETEWQNHEEFLSSLDEEGADVDYSGSIGDLVDEPTDSDVSDTLIPTGEIQGIEEEETGVFDGANTIETDSYVSEPHVSTEITEPQEDNFFEPENREPIEDTENRDAFYTEDDRIENNFEAKNASETNDSIGLGTQELNGQQNEEGFDTIEEELSDPEISSPMGEENSLSGDDSYTGEEIEVVTDNYESEHSFAESGDTDDNASTDHFSEARERLLETAQFDSPTESDPEKEDRGMKWFTIVVPVVLLAFILVLSGFVFQIHLQLDELQSSLPDESEGLFSDTVISTSSSVNDAVIENINARIDNLADTIELVSNTGRIDDGAESSKSGNVLNRATSQFYTQSQIKQLIAEKLAENTDADIKEINQRINTLNETVKKITRVEGPGKARRPEVTPKPKKTVSKAKERQPVIKSYKTPKTNKPAATKNKQRASAISDSESKNTQGKAKGIWAVNLMSVKERSIADKQLSKFKKQGVAAVVKSVKIKGKRWYRIQVTGFKTRQQAQTYAKSVKSKLSLSGTWVTR